MYASTASLLSVIAATLSYQISKRDQKTDKVAVHHYLALECHRHSGTDITENEKMQISRFRGWRRRLSASLCEIWQIPKKSIEIGATVLTNHGAITHIVHLMPTEDIEAYKTGISGDKLSDKKVEEIGLIITRTFYANHRFEINDIFRSHFSVGSDFTVEFFDRIEKGKRRLNPKGDVGLDLEQKSPHFEVESTSQVITSDDASDYEERIKIVFKEYFGDNVAGDVEAKKAKIMEWMESMIEGTGGSDGNAGASDGVTDALMKELE